jgi:hypothetical protein
MVPGDVTELLQRCGGYTYEQRELRGRVKEERRGKEMDGYPLTLPPLQKCGVTTCEDRQEVARSALVKGIELKMATLIWRAVPGYLQWNCIIFSFAYICVCIVTLIIALPLDHVLQAVVTHSAIQYSLNLILFLTVDKSWG